MKEGEIRKERGEREKLVRRTLVEMFSIFGTTLFSFLLPFTRDLFLYFLTAQVNPLEP